MYRRKRKELNMSVCYRWVRSKVFPEVVYSKQIPNKLLIEEDGKVSLYGGRVDEVNQRFEKGMKKIRCWSRLDNAKRSLIEMEVKRIEELLMSRKVSRSA
jgi:hypothetical protein